MSRDNENIKKNVGRAALVLLLLGTTVSAIIWGGPALGLYTLSQEPEVVDPPVVEVDYYSFNVTDALTGKVLTDAVRKTYVLDTDGLTDEEIYEKPFSAYTLDDTQLDIVATEKVLKANFVDEKAEFLISCDGYYSEWVDFKLGMNNVSLFNASTSVAFTGYDNLGNSTLNQTITEKWNFMLRANTDTHESKLGIPGINYDCSIKAYNYTGIKFTFNATLALGSWISVDGYLAEVISGSSVYVYLGNDWTTEKWTNYEVTFSDKLNTDFEVISAVPFVGNIAEGTVTTLASAYV